MIKLSYLKGPVTFRGKLKMRMIMQAGIVLMTVVLFSQMALADQKGKRYSLEYIRPEENKTKSKISVAAAAAKTSGGGSTGGCTDTGESGSDKPVKATEEPVKSSSFPCNAAPGDASKKAAMDQILDALGIPAPGCSGTCEKRKTCAMQGILSPNGDPVDFTIVEDGDGQCHYEGKIYQDGTAYMRADCGCE